LTTYLQKLQSSRRDGRVLLASENFLKIFLIYTAYQLTKKKHPKTVIKSLLKLKLCIDSTPSKQDNISREYVSILELFSSVFIIFYCVLRETCFML
jgi:hypothetical protein